MAGDEKPAVAQTGAKPSAPLQTVAEAKAAFFEAMDTNAIVTDTIKDYPFTSVAVAAGAGFILADSPLTRMLAGKLTKHVFKDALRAFREFRRTAREAAMAAVDAVSEPQAASQSTSTVASDAGHQGEGKA